MPDPRQEAVLAHFRRSQQAVERASADEKFVAATVAIAERISAALKSGGKVLLAGNGGSAADAQHIAAEFVGRFIDDRAPLAAIALTTDTSALTAIANDYGFEQVFARQVEGLGARGDVLIAMSTSGRSANILAALKKARERGLVTVGFTGAAGAAMGTDCDHLLIAPSDDTPVVQQIHLAVGHGICDEIEQTMMRAAPGK